MTGCCRPTATIAPGSTAVRDQVRDHYGAAATALASGSRGCCGSSDQATELITRGLYSAEQAEEVPAGLLNASFGCGNPTALADLREGETVLDLGSGAGLDVILSARRVGPTGRAYGLDMTDEMLALALRHQAEAGIHNAVFLRGTIESIPLPDRSVDVVISNCVVNLSPEKERVFGEILRVLRPGGRIAIADIVFRSEPPAAVRGEAGLWCGCIGGALTIEDYRQLLEEAGFIEVEVEVEREYGPALVEGAPELAEQFGGGQPVDAVSAFIRALRPR